MELGVRGLGSAPPDCCVIWVGPLPSLGLGFLESTCHLQVAVPSTSHSGERTLSSSHLME